MSKVKTRASGGLLVLIIGGLLKYIFKNLINFLIHIYKTECGANAWLFTFYIFDVFVFVLNKFLQALQKRKTHF